MSLSARVGDRTVALLSKHAIPPAPLHPDLQKIDREEQEKVLEPALDLFLVCWAVCS